MNMLSRNKAPEGAFQARQLPADPAIMSAYFEQVASYEADKVKSARRSAVVAYVIAGVGAVAGIAGMAATASLAPLKTVVPLVFRVDNTSGSVERIYDVTGGKMAASDATTRYFLWQYVRLRQTYSPAEAETAFNAVTLMSSPAIQNEYQQGFRGSNPNSPQVVLGRDGSASVRWVSTSMLGPKLGQVRFVQIEKRGGVTLPEKRMVATIAFDFSVNKLSSSALNVNPLGFVVTSYRADQEFTQ
jgi:type IV secretion system protein VirB8